MVYKYVIGNVISNYITIYQLHMGVDYNMYLDGSCIT
jgi:hypothetical protein